MPIYEYECVECGVFSDLQPMSRSAQPATCPGCGAASPRIISAPYVAGMPRAQRQAWERNERSAHEPQVRRKSACGCHGAHTCRSAKESEPASAAPLKAASRRSQRPWMLGH